MNRIDYLNVKLSVAYCCHLPFTLRQRVCESIEHSLLK